MLFVFGADSAGKLFGADFGVSHSRPKKERQDENKTIKQDLIQRKITKIVRKYINNMRERINNMCNQCERNLYYGRYEICDTDRHG